MKSNIKELIHYTIMVFFIITVCVMFVISAANALFAEGFGYRINAAFPWEMMLTGLLGALPTLVFCFRGEPTKRQFYTRVALHFLMIEAVILTEGFFLRWITDFSDCAIVALMILIVYALVWLFTILSNKKHADHINRALKSFNQDETEDNA